MFLITPILGGLDPSIVFWLHYPTTINISWIHVTYDGKKFDNLCMYASATTQNKQQRITLETPQKILCKLAKSSNLVENPIGVVHGT